MIYLFTVLSDIFTYYLYKVHNISRLIYTSRIFLFTEIIQNEKECITIDYKKNFY